MNPKFEIICDSAFLISALQRYHNQRAKFVLAMIIKIFASVMLALLAGLVVFKGKFGWAVFFVMLIFLLFFARKIDYWIAKRGLRKSPYNNLHTKVSMSHEGLHTLDEKSDIHLKWSAFTKAMRLHDGFLLFQGPRLFNWLPHSALVEGDPEDVDLLLKENIKNYKKRRQVAPNKI